MAFACERVVSEPGNPVSFEHLLDGIEAADFPAPTGQWFAVFCFYSPEETTLENCRVVVVDGRGDVIAQTRVKDVTFTADNPVSRNAVSFHGLAWPYPGRYFVRFVANRDDVLAFFPMFVQHVSNPEVS